MEERTKIAKLVAREVFGGIFGGSFQWKVSMEAFEEIFGGNFQEGFKTFSMDVPSGVFVTFVVTFSVAIFDGGFRWTFSMEGFDGSFRGHFSMNVAMEVFDGSFSGSGRWNCREKFQESCKGVLKTFFEDRFRWRFSIRILLFHFWSIFGSGN
jgi:hypothetical protein